MNTSRGFVLPVLLLIIIGLIVLGGGTYFVTHQTQSTQTSVQEGNGISSSTQSVGAQVQSTVTSLRVTKISDDKRSITVEYTNIPREARTLFLCAPSGACTDWGVDFAPQTSNGTFLMTHDPNSTKHIGDGVYTIQAVDFGAGKIFATSEPFTVASSAQINGASLSATIDQSSLTTSSPNPIITGTAHGYGVLNVNVLPANGDEQLFSGNIPVTNNTWAFKVSSEFSAQHTSLVPGMYRVKLSDKSGFVLAEGNLIILSN